jgi:hypothetical protein
MLVPAVRLSDTDPDLLRYLREDERAAAGRLHVPTETVGTGPLDLDALLAQRQAFGALVLEGMIVCRWRVGGQVALGTLGPGDILPFRDGARSLLLGGEDLTVTTTPTRLGMLGEEWLVGVRRWPRLSFGMLARMGEQHERLAAHLAVCQLPRVEERLLALMWLLAETWGHVSPLGTVLPLTMTHEVLGGLVGSRRPTVTLALGALTQRGSIVRQDGGWLLLEVPKGVTAPARPGSGDRLVSINGDGRWRASEQPRASASFAHLRAIVERLSAEHSSRVEDFRARRTRMAGSVERCQESRRRIRRARHEISRRRAPS